MPNISQLTGVIKDIQPIFWVIDTSGSMAGSRIKLCENIFTEFAEICEKNPNIDTRTEVLSFNSKAEWVTDSIWMGEDDFEFQDLQLKTEGLTNVGNALQELDIRLSLKNIRKDEEQVCRNPIIIFILDGFSTDDYTSALDELRQNSLFKRSVKFGLAIGTEADTELLREIVGDECFFTEEMQLLDLLSRLIHPTYSETLSTVPEKKVERNMIININGCSYDINREEYRIVRCQLQPCDLTVANQECFVANILQENDLVRLTNIDPLKGNSYIIHLTLERGQSIEVEMDLFENMEISGNIIMSKRSKTACIISGISDSSLITIILGNGMHVDLQTAERFEVETAFSKTVIRFIDEWDIWGDEDDW